MVVYFARKFQVNYFLAIFSHLINIVALDGVWLGEQSKKNHWFASSEPWLFFYGLHISFFFFSKLGNISKEWICLTTFYFVAMLFTVITKYIFIQIVSHWVNQWGKWYWVSQVLSTLYAKWGFRFKLPWKIIQEKSV